jgi:hypothetical protein
MNIKLFSALLLLTGGLDVMNPAVAGRTQKNSRPNTIHNLAAVRWYSTCWKARRLKIGIGVANIGLVLSGLQL